MRVISVSITKNDLYIISRSYDNTIRLWNLPDKRQETVFKGHEDLINTMIITSNDQFIISGSKDKSIIVWNITKKKTRSCV